MEFRTTHSLVTSQRNNSEMARNWPPNGHKNWCICTKQEYLRTSYSGIATHSLRYSQVKSIQRICVKSRVSTTHNTLNSKRKYTLWVLVCEYSKPTSYRTHERVWGIAHWSSTPNKTEFGKKIPSGSKVLNQSFTVCTLSASNTEVNGRNRFLWTFLHDIPANFPLVLWNHLKFLHKLWFDC